MDIDITPTGPAVNGGGSLLSGGPLGGGNTELTHIISTFRPTKVSHPHRTRGAWLRRHPELTFLRSYFAAKM